MSFLIDVFVALLLISAIGYGIVLNRKIVALRRDQAGLEKLASTFQNATKRAEESVCKLKETAQESSVILKEGVDEGVRIRDDLNFLLERGEKLADHLESAVRRTENTVLKDQKGELKRSPDERLETTKHAVKSETAAERKRDISQPIGSVSPEVVANKIVESEVERKFLRALRAVR